MRDAELGDGRARVLIADDHPLLRAALRRLLTSWGHKVVAETGDGEAATRMALTARPDLALLDLVMPGIGGLEAARQISHLCPDTRIVILSGYLDAERRAAAARVGARAVIEKGASLDQVRAVLDAVGEGRRNADGGDGLTPREREVLSLVAEGYTSATIAARLAISVRTVETHRQNVMAKLGLHSATALTRFAVTHGLA